MLLKDILNIVNKFFMFGKRFLTKEILLYNITILIY